MNIGEIVHVYINMYFQNVVYIVYMTLRCCTCKPFHQGENVDINVDLQF